MDSRKGCYCSGERADYIHDGQKVPGGNSDMLRRWCESARCSTIYRAVLGAGAPEKTEGNRAGGTGARGGDAGTEGAGV